MQLLNVRSECTPVMAEKAQEQSVQHRVLRNAIYQCIQCQIITYQSDETVVGQQHTTQQNCITSGNTRLDIQCSNQVA